MLFAHFSLLAFLFFILFGSESLFKKKMRNAAASPSPSPFPSLPPLAQRLPDEKRFHSKQLLSPNAASVSLVPRITITRPPQPPQHMPLNTNNSAKDSNLLDPFYGADEASVMADSNIAKIVGAAAGSAASRASTKRGTGETPSKVSQRRSPSSSTTRSNCNPSSDVGRTSSCCGGGSGGGRPIVNNTLLKRKMCSNSSGSSLASSFSTSSTEETAPSLSKCQTTVTATEAAPSQQQQLQQKRQEERQQQEDAASQKKGAWSKEEDDLVLRRVALYGQHNWAEVAKGVPGRDRKQCRERYLNHLFPDVKKDAWAKDEDVTIARLHGIYGNAWADIARCLGNGRSPNAVKNRWYSFLKNKTIWTLN